MADELPTSPEKLKLPPWQTCDACLGSGKADDGDSCMDCRGKGRCRYTLPTKEEQTKRENDQASRDDDKMFGN